MNRAINFTLEYWTDDGWYVGRLSEIPGVFSQGETLEELQENITEAYQLMRESMTPVKSAMTKIMEIEVAA
ncbi:MAG TPA: HicB family protein [Desulfobacteraceae bacterium]|nr:HicB family protein [Desulfobacteraceae bacterium]